MKLSQKQSNVWAALDRPEVLSVFAGGGGGGGKSYVGCLRQFYRRTTYAGTRGFIGRESFTALLDSTLKTYFGVLDEAGYKPGEHYEYNAQTHTLVFRNGSEQHFRHMAYQPRDPDYNRFGSTEYTDAFVDEAPEVARRACQVLMSRLRYMHKEHGITPEMLLTGNPGEHWIKDDYVMDANGRFIDLPPHMRRILFTVEDHPDEEFRKRYTKTLEFLDEYDRSRLLYGDWTSKPKAERPFLHAFDEKRHVGKAQRRPNDLHYFQIDFNVEPFCGIASHIWQDADGPHYHTFRETALQVSSIEGMAKWIREMCPMLHLIRITGDRNGYNRAIGKNGPTILYNDLQRELQISKAQIEVPGNPSHLQSREDMNYVYANHPDRIIDTTCTGLISDLRSVEVATVGDTIKIVKGDRSKKNQRADFLDCDRYGVNTYLRKWIQQSRR